MNATRKVEIRAVIKPAWFRGLTGKFGWKLECRCVPQADGMYMGETKAEALAGLAEMNARRAALGHALILVA
jgi:hypothetical protein